MRWIAIVGAWVALLGPALAQSSLYVCVDAPLDAGDAGFVEPWHVAEYDSGSYALALDVPATRIVGAVDAVHKMDRPGNWLFSVGAPCVIGADPGIEAESRDVVRFDGSSYSIFFSGGAVSDPIPANNGIDALYLDGSDDGDLILSFRSPVELPADSGNFRAPADLVRFRHFGNGAADWSYEGVVFDSSAVGDGVLAWRNVIGADDDGGRTLLVFDDPVVLDSTDGPTILERGQVVSWDGTSFGVVQTLADWPGNRRVDALSCEANPGEVIELTMDRPSSLPGTLRILWEASCASGVDDYGIYEGALGSFDSHVLRDCTDDGADRVEDLPIPPGDAYYLVVPYNGSFEGSYGEGRIKGLPVQRPQAADPADRCVAEQRVSACPS
jgi:hypothetical protein